jgi:hypothetical protein
MPKTLFKDPESGRLVEIVRTENGSVQFSLQGGGFVKTMDETEFFRKFSRAELPPFLPATFSCDAFSDELPGYTNKQRWNGWSMPYFPLTSGKALEKLLPDLKFDEAQDAFVYSPEGGDVEAFPSTVIRVFDRDLKVYPIGAGSWCWDQVDEESHRPPRPRG